MPVQLSTEVTDLIKYQANDKKIRADLLSAIIQIESEGDPLAIRYERNYMYYYRPEVFCKDLNISLDTEKALQRFSYGLMQIMGGTARGLGYTGHLTDLLKADVGIEWGARYLKSVMNEYLDLDDQISVYNAGSIQKDLLGNYKNQEYVDNVTQLLNVRLVQ